MMARASENHIALVRGKWIDPLIRRKCAVQTPVVARHSSLNPRRRRVVDDTQAAEELVGDAEEHDAEQPVGEEKHDAEELRERAHREHDAR